MQTAPGVFKESTFRALDYVLHTAAKYDVRCMRALLLWLALLLCAHLYAP
jgi:hypothetical protein